MNTLAAFHTRGIVSFEKKLILSLMLMAGTGVKIRRLCAFARPNVPFGTGGRES